MARLAAFIVMLIPGLMAAGGIKFMRDTLFVSSFHHSHFMVAICSWCHFLRHRLWVFR